MVQDRLPPPTSISTFLPGFDPPGFLIVAHDYASSGNLSRFPESAPLRGWRQIIRLIWRIQMWIRQASALGSPTTTGETWKTKAARFTIAQAISNVMAKKGKTVTGELCASLPQTTGDCRAFCTFP